VNTSLEPDTGLANMILAAQPGEHGVIADWIEDHLQLDDLAAVVRAGVDDPRRPEDQARTHCGEFRYRQIDRFILFTMARYHIHQPFVAGQARTEDPTGFVVCLCTSPHRVHGVRRWGRWFPATISEPALGRLWDDLGKELPTVEPE
jgi:hypothetical protein